MKYSCNGCAFAPYASKDEHRCKTCQDCTTLGTVHMKNWTAHEAAQNFNGMLLPCNLEQLNDRILNLDNGIARMGEQDTIRVHKAFLVDVLGYMEELLGLRRRSTEINNLAVGYEEDGPFDDQQGFDRVAKIYRLSSIEEKGDRR